MTHYNWPDWLQVKRYRHVIVRRCIGWRWRIMWAWRHHAYAEPVFGLLDPKTKEPKLVYYNSRGSTYTRVVYARLGRWLVEYGQRWEYTDTRTAADFEDDEPEEELL